MTTKTAIRTLNNLSILLEKQRHNYSDKCRTLADALSMGLPLRDIKEETTALIHKAGKIAGGVR